MPAALVVVLHPQVAEGSLFALSALCPGGCPCRVCRPALRSPPQHSHPAKAWQVAGHMCSSLLLLWGCTLQCAPPPPPPPVHYSGVCASASGAAQCIYAMLSSPGGAAPEDVTEAFFRMPGPQAAAQVLRPSGNVCQLCVGDHFLTFLGCPWCSMFSKSLFCLVPHCYSANKVLSVDEMRHLLFLKSLTNWAN